MQEAPEVEEKCVRRNISGRLSPVRFGLVCRGDFQEIWDVDDCRTNPHPGRHGVCVRDSKTDKVINFWLENFAR